MLDFKKSKVKRFLQKTLGLLYIWKRKKYNRILPLCEYFNGKKEKAQKMGWGSGSTCYDSVYIFGDVKVGANTFVGPFCILDGSGGLKIGSNCSIAAGVHIYTHDSVQWAVSGGIKSYEYNSVSIEDNCYIGPSAIISRGVKIGNGAVIGAYSFVNRDIPEYAKAVGIPARIISMAEGGNNLFASCSFVA